MDEKVKALMAENEQLREYIDGIASDLADEGHYFGDLAADVSGLLTAKNELRAQVADLTAWLAAEREARESVEAERDAALAQVEALMGALESIECPSTCGMLGKPLCRICRAIAKVALDALKRAQEGAPK